MISVHEWTQPAQERTKKPNSEWGITSVMELEVNQDLKLTEKCPKRPDLPSSL